jgi:peptide/nickel transport system permease protein
MWKYLGTRLLQMMITLVLFQAATYFLIDAQPGDIADLLANNPDIPPSERQRVREEFGLDKPPVERFIIYMKNFYSGDLGLSFIHYPRSVSDILLERIPRTLVLFITAIIVSFYTGYISGKFLAWRRGGWIEVTTTITGVILYTVFTPMFALMMIWLFAVQLDWLPAGKFLDPVKWLRADIPANTIFSQMIWTAIIALLVMVVGLVISNTLKRRQRARFRAAVMMLPVVAGVGFWWVNGLGVYALDILSHLVLPVITVTLVAYAGTMLLMRTSMLETLKEDYILTARAKGLPDKVVRDKHAARNALLPVWTSLVFGIGGAISGGIVTETIFSWPGVGLTLLSAATTADIPLALGALTIIGILTLISHLVADIGYAFLDPRIRYQ